MSLVPATHFTRCPNSMPGIAPRRRPRHRTLRRHPRPPRQHESSRAAPLTAAPSPAATLASAAAPAPRHLRRREPNRAAPSSTALFVAATITCGAPGPACPSWPLRRRPGARLGASLPCTPRPLPPPRLLAVLLGTSRGAAHGEDGSPCDGLGVAAISRCRKSPRSRHQSRAHRHHHHHQRHPHGDPRQTPASGALPTSAGRSSSC
mmetsp:Transcript_111273/g.321741  ORF Transcript_111273/g.321741 Transcript_111273/m.321741 type:complete len:206 (+) Transcript_111273:254-871(+)